MSNLLFGATSPQLTGAYPAPGSAELSEILTVVRKMVLSPAMTAQIAVAAARIVPGAVPVSMQDMSTGATFFSGDLSEIDLAGVVLDNGWLDPAILHCQIAEKVKLTPAFPAIELVARRGGVRLEERWGVGYTYRFDAFCWASGDMPHLFLQRKAMIYAECFLRMMRRDMTLGGLVKMIRASGPVEPGGGGPHGGAVVMAGVAHMEAVVVQP